MAADEPATKKAKVEEDVPPAPRVGEPQKEQEQDTPDDKREALAEDICVHNRDATLNVIPTLGGRVLMPLTDGGLQYLIGGVRANVGIKAGRYCFEVKIVEALNPAEPPPPRGSTRPPQPRQLVRIGFSTQFSSLFLGDEATSICFDSEGYYSSKKKRAVASQRFGRDQSIAVLLNLDAKSANANTLSLFRDGERISDPQPVPESLQGQALFPTINFKNVTLHVNWGPTLMTPLPFTCRMIQGAAREDSVVAPSPLICEDGKYEVLLPVGLPGEGTFDWLDAFLEKNPQYTELSDRKIIDWATKSGLLRPKATGWKHCYDKPEMNFGLPLMDDRSIQRILDAIVMTQPRNYVVAEVKANLLKDERKAVMKRFSLPFYRKVAQVVMGEPPEEYKIATRELILAEKQERIDNEWKNRLLDADRMKADEARGRIDDAGPPPPPPPVPEDPVKKEEDEEALKKEEEEGDTKVKEEMDVIVKMEVKEEEVESKGGEKDEPCPVATLTDEEQGAWFPKKPSTDLASWTLSAAFANFSIPQPDEGFDEMRYEWAKADASQEYLKKWISKAKITTRIEDLNPGDWFKSKWVEWQRALQDWHAKQNDWQEKVSRRAVLQFDPALPPPPPPPPPPAPDSQHLQGEADTTEATAKPNEEARSEERQKAENPEARAANEESVEEETAPEESNEDEHLEIDIFALEDVSNYKDGEPLFAKFGFEDWTLLSLRFELHLLAHAFQKDAVDPERIGIHETHLPFYYNKYFRKSFNVKYYGVDDNVQLVGLIKDTVKVNLSNQVLETQLSNDMDNFGIFMKLTEEARRERQGRIAAGDENARLRFQRPELAQLPPPAAGGAHPGRDDRRGVRDDRGPRLGNPGLHPHHGAMGKGYVPKGAQAYPQPPAPAHHPPPGGYDRRKGGGAVFYDGQPGVPPPPSYGPPPGKGASHGPGGAPPSYGQRRGAPYPPPAGYGSYPPPGRR